MILFDGCHLASDASLDELNAEGRRLGLKPSWLHLSRAGVYQYDVFGEALKQITKNCTRRDIHRRGARVPGRQVLVPFPSTPMAAATIAA